MSWLTAEKSCHSCGSTGRCPPRVPLASEPIRAARIGKSWIRKFLRHQQLRAGRIHAAFRRQQIPVAFKGSLSDGRQRKHVRRRRLILPQCFRRKRRQHRRDQQADKPGSLEQWPMQHGSLKQTRGVPAIGRGLVPA